jgi:hypothetical protein
LSDSASRFCSDAFPFLTLLLFLSSDILSVFEPSPGSSTNSYIPPSPARLRSSSSSPTFLLSGHCRYTYPFCLPDTELYLLHSTHHTLSPSRDDPASFLFQQHLHKIWPSSSESLRANSIHLREAQHIFTHTPYNTTAQRSSGSFSTTQPLSPPRWTTAERSSLSGMCSTPKPLPSEYSSDSNSLHFHKI